MKNLKEVLLDGIVASLLKGPDKATAKFLQQQAKKDPKLKSQIQKAEKLAGELDDSNQQVLDLLHDKYKGTKYEKYFTKI